VTRAALCLALALVGCHHQNVTARRQGVRVSIVDHGIPVVSSRQWTTALSPNAAGTGWNFIAASYSLHSTSPFEWPVVKGLTSTPSETVFTTLTGIFPNSNFQYTNQLRAQNGRIFFPCASNYTAYYDPSTEQVHQIGPIVETPPIGEHTSTNLYSASFDVGGLLYFATQESEYRPSMVVVTDPDTLEQTILGYVGSGALSYTTYGYYLAPDTATAEKYIYVAYGQNPWQHWALNITPGPNYGVATKLYEVPSTGNIAFNNIAGKGWIATYDTALGQPGNVHTVKWMIDGALYDYVPGVDPPSPRNVTPASNPLVSAPNLDISGGIGVVGWRNGSSGPYTYVNYDVTYYAPIKIEALVDAPAGVVGNVEQYQGWFQNSGSTTRYTPPSFSISQGPRLNIGGMVYAAGYPNGVLARYDPGAAWQAGVNPTLLGYYGPNGTQYAGIKFSDYMAWAPLAGTQGQLYVAGSRERNGVGAGIGAWKKASGAFIGTYAATGLDTVNPDGLAVLADLGYVVMSSHLLAMSGAAPLFIFDYDLNLVRSVAPLAGVTSLGQIYETSTSGIVVGIVQGAGNSLGLWKYNVQTSTLVSYTEVLSGDLQPTQYRRPGTYKVYIVLGNNLVRVDVNTLTAVVVADLTAAAPVEQIALASDGSTMYIAGGTDSGVTGARLYSLALGDVLAADSLDTAASFGDATFSNGGSVMLVADPLDTPASFNPAGFSLSGASDSSSDARTGAHEIVRQNDEGSALLFGQPVYSSGNGRVRLACADNPTTSIVIGVVGKARIEGIESGVVRTGKTVTGTRAQWDAIAGTTGGLVRGATYYLHPSIPGRLTVTAPSVSGQLVPVIQAMSDVQARVVIRAPMPL
jgi:hypothetical protein